MAQTHSKVQLPVPESTSPPGAGQAQAFQRGLLFGREYADTAARRIAAWTEEHPGQALLAGLAAGFLLGKLLLRKRRRLVIERQAED